MENASESHSDLTTREDVRTVVQAFYHDIAEDPSIGAFFDDVDMQAHVPKLVDFWCSVVFQTGTYRGRPFHAHAALNGLNADHFTRWLDRFESIIDERFAGPNAEQMKSRARHIATIFQSKLGVLRDEDVAERFG
ncbi:hypothetical protein CRI93_05925 [Longimonas halophila]|uniref:Sec-independent protein translocase TatC n=1 Tax=Longimonas halophila TaxID=1469170 RepID=A0A2H3NMS8_9BACT|nr:group III truncated hemoglobin [Longimonas halophila]PEN07980.1 hypothetical protein CRI93_05925 [Longimonas halophila]